VIKVVSVDVIIPCKNGEKWLVGTLESVYLQSHDICHIIVVDDGSRKHVSSFLGSRQSRENIRIIRTRALGSSSARNVGIEAADADYIAFLDVDDRWNTNKIANQIATLESNPHAIATFCSAIAVSESGIAVSRWRKAKRIRSLERLLLGYDVITGSASSIIVRRTSIQGKHEFDSNLKFAEDLDMWIQIYLEGEIIPTTSRDVYITNHTDSVQRSITPRQLARSGLEAKIVIFAKNDLLKDSGRRAVSRAIAVLLFETLKEGCAVVQEYRTYSRLVIEKFELNYNFLLAQTLYYLVKLMAVEFLVVSRRILLSGMRLHPPQSLP
jgi:glycosyltransferase involved in cell wall biosynthesis